MHSQIKPDVVTKKDVSSTNDHFDPNDVDELKHWTEDELDQEAMIKKNEELMGSVIKDKEFDNLKQRIEESQKKLAEKPKEDIYEEKKKSPPTSRGGGYWF